MNKIKKKDIVVICLMIAVCCVPIVLFGISEVQYSNLTDGMIEHYAVITDIAYDVGRKGYIQDVFITYEVNGETYNRKLGTDTTISFAAGTYGNLQIGDKIPILYNPLDPNEIASERTSDVGRGIFIFSVCSLLFFTWILIIVIKGMRKQRIADQNNQEKIPD
ncbi:MAG: DUF3592 domain-containing protein [Clostridia bacterium]|nr:DUF3592 domain-containing protein [Clostridia bacterium]